MERHLAIINPAAGGGRSGARAPAVLEQLRGKGITLEVEETKGPGDAMRIAREGYDRGIRTFLAGGGDGTSYEIINGLFPRAAAGDTRVALGFLPMGTGNSFLREFTAEGLSYAVQAIVSRKRRVVDVLRFEHTEGVLHFINLWSVGFVADVASLRQRRFKRYGEGGYVFAVLSELSGLRPSVFPMSLEGGPQDRDPLTFLSVNNSKYTGGRMMMAPDADTSDGLFDVVRVGVLSRWGLLRTFPKIFTGTHTRNPAVTTCRARSMTFDLEHEIDIMVDGESIRAVPRAISVVPGALEVIA